MTNFYPNLNTTNNPYVYPFGSTVPSKGINEIKKQNNVAGKVADSYDPSEDPSATSKSFLYSLLMSSAFVRGTNWLMNPKKIQEGWTQLDAYQNSRLYKLGERIDKLPPLQWVSRQAGKIKSGLSKIPVPQFIREIGEKIKTGSTAPWDTQGMYSLGKSGEAMRETANFLHEVGENAIKALKLSEADENFILTLAKKVKTGKLDGADAYRQLEPKIRNLSAQALKNLKVPHSRLDKILGTVSDLNLSVSKARFFAGANASGPVGKAFNKFISLVGEASGGGVLGGKLALIMNAVGLMSGFNAMQKAEKGDKLKAFMEDYIGFTIGGYLMGMVVGKWFNSAMGMAEHGMNLAKAQEIGAAKFGMEGVKRVEDVIIKYNQEFKQAKELNKIMKKFSKGKIVEGGNGIFGWIKNKLTGKLTTNDVAEKLQKFGVDTVGNDVASLKTAIQNHLNIKNPEFFKEVREGLKKATKSNITFFSIFKKGKGGFFNRLGRWIVQKPLATAAKFLSTGRYTMLKNGNFIGNNFRRLKRVGGGIGRMILVGFVLVEPFRKAFVKLSHAIFGKPKHSAIDDENEKKPQEQPVQNIPNVNRPSQNLVDLYTKNSTGRVNSPVQNHTNIPKYHDTYLKHDTATYIPNETLGQESFIDTGLTKDLLLRREMAEKRADAAEANAMKILSGDFS